MVTCGHVLPTRGCDSCDPYPPLGGASLGTLKTFSARWVDLEWRIEYLMRVARYLCEKVKP